MAEDTSQPPPASDTTSEAATVAPNVFKGWAAFQYAMNFTLPQALNRAEAIRVSSLRMLQRG